MLSPNQARSCFSPQARRHSTCLKATPIVATNFAHWYELSPNESENPQASETQKTSGCNCSPFRRRVCRNGLRRNLGAKHEAVSGIADCSASSRGCCVWNHRSEEHTSELQSRGHLVCRLLL